MKMLNNLRAGFTLLPALKNIQHKTIPQLQYLKVRQGGYTGIMKNIHESEAKPGAKKYQLLKRIAGQYI
jgi:hypothetical protein